MSRDAAVDAYFAEVASWETDKVRTAARTVKLVAWGGAMGWLTALAACGALIALTPLKSVEPFVIRVDNTTGVVDVVPTAVGGVTPAQAVTRYFISHYVETCERFNFATAERDYEECAAFHAPQRNQAWAARWARSNPASPLNKYIDGTTLDVQVQSVSFFDRANGVSDLAQVRYTVGQRSGDGAAEVQHPYIATLQYAYAEASADPRNRRWNPLGFKVLVFTPEPETLPTPPAPTPTAVTAMQDTGAAP